MQIDYVAIGERVRQKRRELGLTQEQLAEEVGISASFVGHIERAEKTASVETMMKTAQALNTSLDYLISGIKWRCDHKSCPLFDDIGNALLAYGIEKKE